MAERQFTCARCGETFRAGWSEEEALAEMRTRFPTAKGREEAFSLCDDCDAVFAKWFATLTEEDKARMEAEYRASRG
jgi:hypothetical protein